jgi:hypothetical protein
MAYRNLIACNIKRDVRQKFRFAVPFEPPKSMKKGLFRFINGSLLMAFQKKFPPKEPAKSVIRTEIRLWQPSDTDIQQLKYLLIQRESLLQANSHCYEQKVGCCEGFKKFAQRINIKNHWLKICRSAFGFS